MKHSLLALSLLLAPLTAEATPWDYTAGGVPGGDLLLGVDIGFPALPRVSLQYGLTSKFSIGGAAQFDYSGYTYSPNAAFSPAFGVSMPMRIEAYRANRLSFGIKIEPGLLLVFPPRTTVFGIQINTGFNVGYFIVDRFMVGGGLDVPISLFFTGGPVRGVLPLLFGPILEFHVNDTFAIAFDLKLGPGINLGGGGTYFALKTLFGFVFHF